MARRLSRRQAWWNRERGVEVCRKICDRGYILQKGRIQVEGTMDRICGDEQVVREFPAV
jgi:ABC-type branched-subunit amino acid transport system ATPase component